MFNKHEGYDADGTAFKHLETTKRISVTFKQKRGDYTYKPQPNPSHNYVAKIANKNGYLKDCPVKLEGNRFIISTADLVDLTVGRYYLEVWESYQDDTGKDQLSIYPSPDSRVDFDIEPNIMETTGETIKELGFQDLVDATAKKVNLSITLGDTDILPAGSKPSVSESRQDDKLVLTFHLPAGSTGNTSGGTTNIDVSNYYTKQEVDTKLQNYAKKSELPDTSKFVTTNDVPTVSLSLSNRTITVNGTTLAIPDSVDLSGYATKQEIPKLVYDASSHSLTINGQQISLPSNVDLSDYYTKEQVDSKVAQAASGGHVDLTDYLKVSDADAKYATKAELPDLSNYALKQDVPSIVGLAKQSEIPQISLNVATRTLTLGTTSIQIPNSVDLSGYATKSELPQVTMDVTARTITIAGQTITIPQSVNLNDYYTKGEIDAKIAKAQTGGQVDLSNYLTINDAEDKYATKQELPTVSLDVAKRTVNINGQSIAVPEQVDLSNFYTKAEVDSAIADHKVDLTGYLTVANADSTYAKKSEIPAAPDLSGYALKTDVPSVTDLAKESDIPQVSLDATGRKLTINGTAISIPDAVDLTGYLTKEVADQTYATPTLVDEKVNAAKPDLSGITSAVAANKNDISKMASNQKIDTKHLEENNKPSEFPDGFSYALKKAEAIGIDRSDFAKDAQAGSKGLLTTKAVSGLVKQHFELLDGLEPLHFERTGSDDTWTDWFCMTS